MPQSQLFYFLSAIENGILSPSSIPEVTLFATNKKKAVRFAGNNLYEFITEGAKYYGWLWSSFKMLRVERGDNWSDLYPVGEKKSILTEDKNDFESIYVIGRNQKYVNDLCFEEENNPVVAGEMLGYPACCIKKFSKFYLEKEHWARFIITDSQAVITANAQCNRLLAELGGISPIGEMYPCSLRCNLATKMANKAIEGLVDLGLIELSHFLKESASFPLYISKAEFVSRYNQIHSDTKIIFSWE